MKQFRKRRFFCVIFTQAVATKIATGWWKNKLFAKSQAAVMTVLMNSFDEKYNIYRDVTDLAMFFE